MKVFIVYENEDLGISIVDVFDSVEKAQKCVDDQKAWADKTKSCPRLWYYEFDEYEVK